MHKTTVFNAIKDTLFATIFAQKITLRLICDVDFCLANFLPDDHLTQLIISTSTYPYYIHHYFIAGIGWCQPPGPPSVMSRLTILV